MSIKDAQISVRLPAVLAEWLDRRAGEERSKADVVRDLIEREISREEAAKLTAMFDAAAEELTDEDREDRDLVLGAFSDTE